MAFLTFLLLLSPLAAATNDTVPTTDGKSLITVKSNTTNMSVPTTTKETTETITAITTTTSTTTSSQKTQSLCENYATIIDDSRLFSNPSEENKCDFYFRKAVRFMSSKGKNLQLKENCSNEEVNQLRYYCGSSGLTYMEQLHPEKSDVPSPASVCVNTFFDYTSNLQREDIFPRPDCKCNRRQNVLVQNCSGFYVYQLVPISLVRYQCAARYCTEEISKCCLY